MENMSGSERKRLYVRLRSEFIYSAAVNIPLTDVQPVPSIEPRCRAVTDICANDVTTCMDVIMTRIIDAHKHYTSISRSVKNQFPKHSRDWYSRLISYILRKIQVSLCAGSILQFCYIHSPCNNSQIHFMYARISSYSMLQNFPVASTNRFPLRCCVDVEISCIFLVLK